MLFLHSIRDTVIRDKARTRLYQEPRKGRCSGRDFGKTGRHQWNKERLCLRKERTSGMILGIPSGWKS
jgi:hypothetical protein